LTAQLVLVIPAVLCLVSIQVQANQCSIYTAAHQVTF